MLYTHSVSHAHFPDTSFFCVAYRHRVHAWLKVFAVRMSNLLISPSPFSCHVSFTVFAVPAQSPRHFVPVCTFLAELFPIRKAQVKRTHERREVWLLGRSDALHRCEVDALHRCEVKGSRNIETFFGPPPCARQVIQSLLASRKYHRISPCIFHSIAKSYCSIIFMKN